LISRQKSVIFAIAMPLTCAIAGCSNNYQRTKGNKISFHLFPKNESARQEWIKLCGRDHPFNAKTWRVCSLHFDANDFERDLHAELLNYTPKAKKLKLGALPIIVNKQKEDNNFISVPSSTSELQEPMEVKTLDISDWQRESIINLKATIERLNEEMSKKDRQLRLMRKKIYNLRTVNRAMRRKAGIPCKCADILSKTFTSSQILKMKGSKKITWTPEDITRAFTLRYLSKRSYVYLRDSLV
jgi:hypothetical protein